MSPGRVKLEENATRYMESNGPWCQLSLSTIDVLGVSAALHVSTFESKVNGLSGWRGDSGAPFESCIKKITHIKNIKE